ncbi:MAG: helix-turn-helix domain-containing protein [Clostridia bacterium]|nr:helix-turn-helix domain-containing protein [Clostridia bacterium]
MNGIGIKLKNERENKGLSLQEAAIATKIRLKYLEAIENGSFEIIPAEVYLKGFLKIYGDYLGLKGQTLVNEYKELTESNKEPSVCEDKKKTGILGNLYKTIFG